MPPKPKSIGQQEGPKPSIVDHWFIDNYRIPQPQTAEHTFFSSMQGMFYRTDNTLVNKINLNESRRMEIISNMISDFKVQNSIKFEEEKNKENTIM